MTPEQITEVMRHTLTVTIELAFPFLFLALVTGLLVALFQSVTQLQELTLSFIPKMLVLGFCIALLFPWMLKILTKFTHSIFFIEWDKVIHNITYVF